MQRRPPESASLNWHTAVWWVSIMAYVRSKEFQRKDALNIFLTGKQVHIQTMTRIKASDKSNCTMNWEYLLETISPTFWHAPGLAQCVLIYCCLSFSAFSSRFSVWPGADSCWAMFIAFIIHPFNYPNLSNILITNKLTTLFVIRGRGVKRKWVLILLSSKNRLIIVKY